MDKNRVYGEKIPIHMEKVQSFYNKRASLIAQKGWGAICETPNRDYPAEQGIGLHRKKN